MSWCRWGMRRILFASWVREEVGICRRSLRLTPEIGGYPPYHPAMMVALLLYAYSRGVYSSRAIARGCEERGRLHGGDGAPLPELSHRQRLPQAPSWGAGEGLFGQVLGLCRRAGLVKLGHVGAGRHQGQGQRLEAQGDELRPDGSRPRPTWRPRLRPGWSGRGAVDAAEDAEHGAEKRGDEMPSWVADKQQRLARIKEAKAALEAETRDREADAKAARGVSGKPEGWSRRVRCEAARQGAAQLHRPGQPHPQDQGRLRPGLQRPGRGRCRPSGDRRSRADRHGQRSGPDGAP